MRTALRGTLPSGRRFPLLDRTGTWACGLSPPRFRALLSSSDDRSGTEVAHGTEATGIQHAAPVGGDPPRGYVPNYAPPGSASAASASRASGRRTGWRGGVAAGSCARRMRGMATRSPPTWRRTRSRRPRLARRIGTGRATPRTSRRGREAFRRGHPRSGQQARGGLAGGIHVRRDHRVPPSCPPPIGTVATHRLVTPALSLRVPPLRASPVRPRSERKRPSARTSTRGVTCQLRARYGPHVTRARSAFSVARPTPTPMSQPRNAPLRSPTGIPRPTSHSVTSRSWQVIPWQPLAPPSFDKPTRASQRADAAAASAVRPANGPTTCTVPNSTATSAAPLTSCAIAWVAISAEPHSTRPTAPRYDLEERLKCLIPNTTSAGAMRSRLERVTPWPGRIQKMLQPSGDQGLLASAQAWKSVDLAARLPIGDHVSGNPPRLPGHRRTCL